MGGVAKHRIMENVSRNNLVGKRQVEFVTLRCARLIDLNSQKVKNSHGDRKEVKNEICSRRMRPCGQGSSRGL